MCLYEKAGWPGYRDLGFCDRVLVNQVRNFSHMNTPARILGLSGTKQIQLRMACKVADKSECGFTDIWGAFWTFFISLSGKNVQGPQKTHGTAFQPVSDFTSHAQLEMFRHGQSWYPGWSVNMGKISSSVQPALSYEHITIFVKKRVARQNLENQASPVDWAHMKRL